MTPENVVTWMPKSSCFRTPFNSQSVHGSQTLLKLVWQDVYLDFPLILDKTSQKTSVFVRCEILRVFDNRLAADHMYSRHNWGKLRQHDKTTLAQQRKTNFYCIFAMHTKFCTFWKKKVRIIAEIVGKLFTPRNVVAWVRESSFFRTPFGSETVHGRKALLKSVFQDVYPNFPSIQEKLSQKTSLFIRCEILGNFSNTLAASHMYSRHNWGKFTQHVKTALSQKRKTFFVIFIAFL